MIKIQNTNFDENIASEFLIDDYRLFLKIQGLTSGTINFGQVPLYLDTQLIKNL